MYGGLTLTLTLSLTLALTLAPTLTLTLILALTLTFHPHPNLNPNLHANPNQVRRPDRPQQEGDRREVRRGSGGPVAPLVRHAAAADRHLEPLLAG